MDTCTYTHQLCRQEQFQEISHVLACGQPGFKVWRCNNFGTLKILNWPVYHLPTCYKVASIMVCTYAELNVKLLFIQGGDSEALDYLSKLMLALDSYYHPSNHGKHTVCMYVYRCVCICMYTCMYVCMYVCVCMYVFTYVHTYICMYVCMYVCMCVHMYVCMY